MEGVGGSDSVSDGGATHKDTDNFLLSEVWSG
jgi:hypothetical protein